METQTDITQKLLNFTKLSNIEPALAQIVEQRIEDPRVLGAIPRGRAFC